MADFPTDTCKGLLRKATGVPDLDLDIRAVKTWNMSAQVAESFQVCLTFVYTGCNRD